MSKPLNNVLIVALRQTAARLNDGARFSWTHMGACHCGQLAQTVTGRSPEEIHALALRQAGDWRAQAQAHAQRDYCTQTGYPLDFIFEALLDLGLSHSDIEHLETLDSPKVLRRFPLGERHLDFRSREDAVRYMNAWADLLEDEASSVPAHAE